MKHKLIEQLRKLNRELSALKSDINKLKSEKEKWFNVKSESSRQASELVKKIKELRAKRDGLTAMVRQSKKSRDELNEEIRAKRTDIKKLKSEKDTLAKHYGAKSYGDVVREIKKIELAIETEIIPFEEEKRLMRKLNKLKETKKNLSAVGDMEKNVSRLYDEIRELRKQAEDFHNTTKSNAEESQLLHNEIIGLSDKLKEADKKGEEVFVKYLELKARIKELSITVKEKRESFDSAKAQLDKLEQEISEKIEKEKQETMQKTEDYLREKIMKGEKVTTSDLLSLKDFDAEE